MCISTADIASAVDDPHDYLCDVYRFWPVGHRKLEDARHRVAVLPSPYCRTLHFYRTEPFYRTVPCHLTTVPCCSAPYLAVLQSLSGDSSDASTWIHFKAEGEVEFKSILFAPSKASYDFYDKYYGENRLDGRHLRKPNGYSVSRTNNYPSDPEYDLLFLEFWRALEI